MREYLDIKDTDANKILIELAYNIGGFNHVSGQFIARGYYLYFTIVQKKAGYAESKLGNVKLIKEVTRKNRKAYTESMMLSKQYIRDIAKTVADEQRWELADNVEATIEALYTQLPSQ